MTVVPFRSDENVTTVSSGGEIDIDRPDFAACKTVEDFIEVKCLLMEKIIDIELQVDIYHIDTSKRSSDWLARAKAALKWAKMYRNECQERQGILSAKIKAAQQAKIDRQVIDTAKAMLPQETFYQIIETATRKVAEH